MDFLIINGEIIRKEEANLTHLFWDEPVVLSQKIWFGYGGIPLFNENVEFLCRQLNAFNIDIPKFLKNTRELFRISKRMLNKNKFYRSGLINIQLYLNDSKINYIITSNAFPEFEFPFSMQGLLLHFSEINKNSENQLNQLEFFNQPLWQIEKLKNKKTPFYSSILLNEKEVICEGITTNIFMIKDNILFTPSLETGCYVDTLRNHILEIASQLNLKVMESSEVKKENIIEMNELFFASEEQGIQWILGINNKRFLHHHSIEIHKKLNDFFKEKVKRN